jgi:hypothetical protein
MLSYWHIGIQQLLAQLVHSPISSKLLKRRKTLEEKNLLALLPNFTFYLAFHRPITQTSIQCRSSLIIHSSVHICSP